MISIRKRNALRICQKCNKEFFTFQSQINRGKGKFCGNSCSTSFRNSLNKKTTEDIFLSNIEKSPDENGCWIYKKASDRYGKLTINRKTYSAHRFSYEYYIGEIPEKMFVCHHCDNPPCVNPKHLFLGSAKDNTKDMINKGRKKIEYGSQRYNAVIDEKMAYEIKTKLKNGVGSYAIASQLNIKNHIVEAIKAEKAWKHIVI